MSHETARVLVVDDEWHIRQQLSRALVSVGINCRCAADADDALEMFLDHRYELVVTDLRMPGRNGHSLAVSLLNQPDPPQVVTLTGVTEPRLAKDLLARGVSAVFLKPINYFDLADRLKSMLQSRDSRRPETTEPAAMERSPQWTEAPAAPHEHPPRCIRQDLEQHFIQSPPPNHWLTMMLQWIDWKRVPDPPGEIRDVMRQLSRHSPYAQAERRREDRAAINQMAVALAFDDQFEPVGQPFKLIVRDLSQHGIGLFHSQRPASKQVAVSWRGMQKTRIIVIARVLRCRPVGEFFDIGAVIARFGNPSGEASAP